MMWPIQFFKELDRHCEQTGRANARRGRHCERSEAIHLAA
jgi:hypothetical protein